jgi:hypothetical protein
MLLKLYMLSFSWLVQFNLRINRPEHLDLRPSRHSNLLYGDLSLEIATRRMSGLTHTKYKSLFFFRFLAKLNQKRHSYKLYIMDINLAYVRDYEIGSFRVIPTQTFTIYEVI